MCNENLINSILLDWASKSSNGLFLEDLNEENLEALHSSLVSNGLSEDDSMGVVNDVSVISEKGKHPERQAYNKNGLLVTFPTPEYKARAITKGTHFEKNPKVGQSNLFGGGQQAPNAAAPAAPAAGGTPASGGSPMDAGSSTLPQTDSGQQQSSPAQKEVPDPGTPGTPASPAPAGGGSSGGSTGTPAQGQLATEPTPQIPAAPANVAPPTPPPAPAPVQKTPEEIAAEKEVIKQIMATSDTLPTMTGIGGVGVSEAVREELHKLTKIALEMNLNEAVRFLSKHL